MKKLLILTVLLISFVLVAPNSHASLIETGLGSLTPVAITVGADLTNPTDDANGVSFGGIFQGQLDGMDMSSGYWVPTPTFAPSVPLSLDNSQFGTFTFSDGPNVAIVGTDPYGSAGYSPISIIFNDAVAYIGFDVHSGFNGRIQEWGVSPDDFRDFGLIDLGGTGSYGFADAGGNVIRGLSIWGTIPGESFSLTNLQFARIESVPEPSTLLLFGTALAGLGFFRKRF